MAAALKAPVIGRFVPEQRYLSVPKALRYSAVQILDRSPLSKSAVQ
jgi:hypothetical protein